MLRRQCDLCDRLETSPGVIEHDKECPMYILEQMYVDKEDIPVDFCTHVVKENKRCN